MLNGAAVWLGAEEMKEMCCCCCCWRCDRTTKSTTVETKAYSESPSDCVSVAEAPAKDSDYLTRARLLILKCHDTVF